MRYGRFKAAPDAKVAFCEGVIFGSKKFVEELFHANRWRFGARRTTGARPMRGMDCPGLFTVRDLRDPVIP